jgi:DNA-binding LacI/PurR family transcriptional regulator
MSILEVSKAAGVSIATVSRVLNGHANVSEAAVKAVHAAVEKVGHQVPEFRNNIGRPSLATAGIRSGAIAVVFPDVNQEALKTTLSARLLSGISGRLQARGLNMLVTGLEREGDVPACVERKQVDGVIVRGTTWAVELCKSMQSLPLVWMFESGYQPALEADMVIENNESIGAMAAQWLIGRKHRRLAIISLLRNHPALRLRRMFFCEMAEQAGVDALVLSGDKTDAEGLVDRMLAETNRPTGLFVPGSDAQVVDVYRALSARGVKIGKDIDLISCSNDANRMSALDPTLPNIDIQPELIGRAAVDSLLWRLRHRKEEPRRTVIAPHFMTNGVSPVFPSKDARLG